MTTGHTQFGRARIIDPRARVPVPEFHDTGFQNLRGTLWGRTNFKPHTTPGLRRLHTYATTADSGANAKLSDAATTDAFLGTTAVRYTATASATDKITPAAFLSTPIDVTNGIVFVWFRNVAGTSSISALKLNLFSAGTAGSPGGNYTQISLGSSFRTQAAPEGHGWWRLGVSAAQITTVVGAGATMSSIIGVQLEITVSGATCVMDVGAIEWAPNARTKGAAILTFDDSHSDQYTYAAAQMARYGFRGVLYPSPAGDAIAAASKMTAAQISTLHDVHGWQVATQDYTNQGANGSAGEAQTLAEHMQSSRVLHSAYGWTGGLDNSYPGGNAVDNLAPTTKAHVDLLRQFGRTARQFIGGSATGQPFPWGDTFPFADPFLIRGLNANTWTDTTNGSQNIAHAQQAIDIKGVATFVWHGGLGTAGNQQDGFNALLAFLDANRSSIDVLTYQDLAP